MGFPSTKLVHVGHLVVVVSVKSKRQQTTDLTSFLQFQLNIKDQNNKEFFSQRTANKDYVL